MMTVVKYTSCAVQLLHGLQGLATLQCNFITQLALHFQSAILCQLMILRHIAAIVHTGNAFQTSLVYQSHQICITPASVLFWIHNTSLLYHRAHVYLFTYIRYITGPSNLRFYAICRFYTFLLC